ncbi:hypothetical protein ACFY00_05565 [Kitasatospora sp. NPDC001540]|uniref:hypothetical protein n=1 Tax=Kitasatospora sp. NPDC001540 TaxID=3364014 RepID=UPI0036B0E87F
MTEWTARATGTEPAPVPAGRTAARWAVLCALLLGLFLMHGSPASATGCHPAQTAHPAQAAQTAHPAQTAQAAHPARHGPAADRPAVSTPLSHGSSASACVSTPARDRLPLPAPGPALPPAPPHPPLAGPSCTGAERGGRAPPDGGRDLLLLVCVARR